MEFTRALRWLLIAGALLIASSKLIGWAVEYLWFDALGYVSVFWTLRLVKLGLFLVAFLLVLIYLWINMFFLAACLARMGTRGPASVTPGLFKLAAVGVALAYALGFTGEWDTLLRYVWAQPVGRTDPVYGLDIGFYLFALPFVEMLQNALLVLFLLATALLAWVYWTAGALRFEWAGGLQGISTARWHVTINLALLLLALAAGFYLDRFELLQSTEGAVHGAGYTDVHVLRPALATVAVVTAMLAGAVLAPRVQRAGSGALAVFGGYMVLLFLGLVLLPWSVQGLRVKPNELQLEHPFLEHNIAFTRAAFGLEHVDERLHDSTEPLELAVLERNRPTVENIRLWDWGPLRRTFRQLQQIRSYYEFNDVDVDRYRVDGAYRQVMLSARELSDVLQGKTRTWVNRRLQYTHGYGLVISLAAEKTGQGAPLLLVKDLPPRAQGGLEVHQPAIYYGDTMSGYRIVATGVKEFDYPKGDENVYTRYEGRGGVALDAAWKRGLFALHQIDASVLLSGYITPRSRIQFWRRVRERTERLAPFLRFDDDPYLVLSDGRLYWIQDAYTVSSTFPYSEPYAGDFNYIRNSVKVVVDAYDGSVRFYVMEPEDPVLSVYRLALPKLFRPLNAMPEELRGHLRYPQQLFEAQAAMYSIYHMTVPQVFYNREDVWSTPWEKFGGEQVRMKPYYVLMKLPEEERLEFLLMLPLTPNNRDNMIAWMAARCDFPGYGELVVFKLPKERLIVGPTQIEAMIDQDTAVSQQLSLWDQRGSRVLRGNLLVIPIERSFIYVEPVFLIAEGTDLPQLKRVIVSDGERLAMEPTLEESLRAVFGDRPREEAGPPRPHGPGRLSEAREALEAAEKALREGRWEAFGGAMRALERVLSE
ncbi:MAG: UPF0182 family protein [Gammaproteobacteria bacterium]|nr:UPF0182 family protein [Gammaproteobacteria bacterium]NIR83692.1 UPF0182 family protein [Gammaproteobacteria bacterium]NIR91667.1 UPF0182 family protein [Gammaproteobacteria bacterium]NIU04854.1 UPF0182 family protein [Gammaproteobacteria bacterium]NIV51840.1 UPF0182 family protein [Gammaproteobacteria bacterium]